MTQNMQVECDVLKVQCVRCENFHIFTDFIKTRKKDEKGENGRNKVCKHCVYINAKGRDKRKTHLNAIRFRCKKRGIPFNMTLEDLEIPKVCPILGVEILESWGDGGGFAKYNSPSVDKIIPELGYVKGNIQIISNRANQMKTDATIENIRSLLAYMEKNLNMQG